MDTGQDDASKVPITIYRNRNRIKSYLNLIHSVLGLGEVLQCNTNHTTILVCTILLLLVPTERVKSKSKNKKFNKTQRVVTLNHVCLCASV